MSEANLAPELSPVPEALECLHDQDGNRIVQLRGDIARATSTFQGKKLHMELNTLRKQEVDLRAFDEKPHHFADLRIILDLADGVKMNYCKFGDFLAKVKGITGGKDQD